MALRERERRACAHASDGIPCCETGFTRPAPVVRLLLLQLRHEIRHLSRERVPALLVLAELALEVRDGELPLNELPLLLPLVALHPRAAGEQASQNVPKERPANAQATRAGLLAPRCPATGQDGPAPRRQLTSGAVPGSSFFGGMTTPFPKPGGAPRRA